MNRMRGLWLFSGIIIPLLGADTIRIESGELSGAPGRNPEVRVYRGIPYAAPPVGPQRWKAPRALATWKGVRHATEFSPVCYQQEYAKTSVYYSPLPRMSEDCLYLNVWSAAKPGRERRPVMVWIHGGGLTRGSGGTPTYDGESLAAKGVVVVTINYRLNVFGLFAHPALTRESDRNTSGNYAFLDQIAALQWVKKNIAAFGGDPSRVTIFGESAGAASVNILMASPLAKGLFHRAIGESGSSLRPVPARAEIEAAGQKFEAALGASGLDGLRNVSAEDLLKASGAEGFRPNVDGYVLPGDVYSIYAREEHTAVPLIAGSNADEGTTLAPWPSSGTRAMLEANTRRILKDRTADYLKLYPEDPAAAHYAIFSDALAWQMRTWAALNSGAKAPSYRYYFTRIPPGPGSEKLRAYHAAEIIYVFHNLALGKRPYDETDQKLSDLMAAYWVNFAATGDPNRSGLPEWPAYSKEKDATMEFGDKVKVIDRLHADALSMLDTAYRR